MRVAVVGASASECEIESGGAPFTVSPGQGHDLVARLSPAGVGPKAASLLFVSNDPDEILFEVTLSGYGVVLEPDIHVDPPSHDFGDAPSLVPRVHSLLLSKPDLI